MNAGTVSFILWAFLMLTIVVALFLAGRKARRAEEELEETASEALPEIGEIADTHHQRKYGKPSSVSPKNGESWYPELKKKSARHA